MDQAYVVRCRGLPWSCTENDLRAFFGVAAESIVKVVLTKTKEGRASGEAYVQFSDEKGFGLAISKDRENMGNRYVEVFASTLGEMEQPRGYGSRPPPGNSSFVAPNGASVVRLRGLPYGCTKEEIIRFFDGLNIVQGGVVLPFEITGRGKGEAYVVFADVESGACALEKNKQNIQHRYIEVFASNQNEMEWALKPNDMPSRSSSYGYGPSHHNNSYGGGPPARGLMDHPYGSSHSQARDAAWGYNDQPGGYGHGGYSAHNQWEFTPVWDRNGPAAAGGGYDYDSGYGRDAGGPMRRGRTGVPSAWGGSESRMSRSPYSMPPANPHMLSSSFALRMRGLPYQATVQDIIDFFTPIRPAKIDILKEKTGRPSGEAIVDFYSKAELDDALSFDRRNMGSRYVELFPEGAPMPRSRRY